MEAYDKAIKLLATREHTEKEMRAKLKQKGFSNADIDSAIARLIAENSLSERRFAESFIRSRLRKSPEGKALLRLRLKDKGTPASIADEVLSEAWESGMYLKPLAMYYSSIERKKGEESARITLLRKGFTERELKEALSLYCAFSESESIDIE